MGLAELRSVILNRAVLWTSALVVKLVVAGPLAAQDSPALAFLQSVGCSVLPMGSCDMLNADNALGIARTYRSILAGKFCGSTNFVEARQLLELGDAPSPNECRALVEVLEGN
jgi:hypothetical protein